jgi:hypothetical protein
MRRLLPIAVSILLGLVGCDSGGSHPTPSRHPERSSPGAHAPPPSTPASPAGSTSKLDEMVLVADLSDRPARWEQVAFLPFGDGAGELRYIPAGEIPAREPTSFAVAEDGSFWILDNANLRLTHFSASGTFLSDVGGYHYSSRDLGFFRGDLYAMRIYQFGRMDRIGADGSVRRYSLKADSHSLYVSDILPTTDALVVRVSGYTRPVATGPMGYYEVTLDGPVPELRELPGVPLGSTRWFKVDASGDQDFDLQFLSPQGGSEQPVHVEVIDPPDSGPTLLEGLVGPGIATVRDGDVAIYVKLVATMPDGRQVGARYLLQVGESQMLWERLPDPKGTSDDQQWRHLLYGPDGRLYLMQTDKDGVRIYRRPS